MITSLAKSAFSPINIIAGFSIKTCAPITSICVALLSSITAPVWVVNAHPIFTVHAAVVRENFVAIAYVLALLNRGAAATQAC
jgi:hypothetical protein